MRSFLLYSANFGSDFNPYPPDNRNLMKHCLINELHRSYTYMMSDYEESPLLAYLDKHQYLYHWEFIRTYTTPFPSRWLTRWQINDFVVIHVNSDDEAFETRIHTDARPLREGWRERFEEDGVGDDEWAN